jgi:hypothetical protein
MSTAFLEIALSNGYVFNNASDNDVVMYPSDENADILIGCRSNANAGIAVGVSNISFNVQPTNSNGVFSFIAGSNTTLMNLYGNRLVDVNGTLQTQGIVLSNTSTDTYASFTTGNGSFVSLEGGNVNFLNKRNICLAPWGGWVGVGTTSPTTTLDVNGDINVSGNFRKGGSIFVGTQWSNNGSNVFILESNVGIGTSTPNYKLDVIGDINFTGTFRQNGNAYVGSQWSNNGSNVFILESNVGIGTSTPNYKLDVNGDINFTGTFRQNGTPYVGSQWSNNSSNVFILGSNVGIGTTSPTDKLSLKGGNLTITNATTGNNGGHNHGGIVWYGFDRSLGNSSAKILSGSLTWDDSGYLSFHTADGFNDGFERMRITETGNVGVGTSNPSYKLDVVGAIRSSSTVSIGDGGLGFGNDNRLVVMNSSAGAGSNVGIQFGRASTNNDSWFILHNTVTSGNGSNSLQFARFGHATPVMTINAFSRVGINTSTPTQALAVNGSIRVNTANSIHNKLFALFDEGINDVVDTATNFYGFGVNASTLRYQVPLTEHNHVFFQSNTAVMLVGSNVGIGTSTPKTRLDVNGSMTLQSNINNVLTMSNNISESSNSIYMDFYNMSGTARGIIGLDGLGYTSAINYGALSISTWTNHAIKFLTNGSERMRITESGNIGISWTTPTFPLEVDGNVRVGNLLQIGRSNTSTILRLTDISKAAWQMTTFDYVLSFQNNSNATNAWETRMTLTASGNLGIGTTSPIDKLSLKDGNLTITNATSQNNGGHNHGGIVWYGFNRSLGNSCAKILSGSLSWDDWGYLSFHTSEWADDTVERMRITQSGNIGVGTTNPSYKLDVSGTGRFTNNLVIDNAKLNFSLAGNTAPPSNGTTGGSGDRIILHPGGTSAVPFSIGINTNTLWYTVPTGAVHQWYVGTTAYLSLSSNALICTQDITAFGSVSDVKFKENIKPFISTSSLNDVMKLRPVSFKWKNDLFNNSYAGKDDVGFIAQEVEEIIPFAVNTSKHDNIDAFKSIKYERLIPYLVGAIHELKKKNDELETRITFLENGQVL